MDDLAVRPTAGLWRRPGAPQVEDYDARFAHFVERESRDAFTGALISSEIRWVTHPRTLWEAELKIVQLSRARRLGLPLPRTLITNDSREAVKFASEGNHVVVKPVRYGLLGSTPEPLVAWTSRVDLASLQDLEGPPVILQDEIRAVAHLRVITIGESVFVSRLVAESLDWRDQPANHERFEVVADEEFQDLRDHARRLADELGLGFSAQDWIETAEEPIFLEANPSGQWLFLDQALEGRLTNAMVGYLEDLAGPRS